VFCNVFVAAAVSLLAEAPPQPFSSSFTPSPQKLACLFVVVVVLFLFLQCWSLWSMAALDASSSSSSAAARMLTHIFSSFQK
jgi:hypothetical protein